MRSEPALALQAALVAALRTNSAVAALVGPRVYDEPPQGAIRPFIRIGGIEPRPLRTDCGQAVTVYVTLQVHSRPLSGRVEATQIAGAVVSALDEQALTVSGYTVTLLQWVLQTVNPDADGQGYTALVTFDVILDA